MSELNEGNGDTTKVLSIQHVRLGHSSAELLALSQKAARPTLLGQDPESLKQKSTTKKKSKSNDMSSDSVKQKKKRKHESLDVGLGLGLGSKQSKFVTSLNEPGLSQQPKKSKSDIPPSRRPSSVSSTSKKTKTVTSSGDLAELQKVALGLSISGPPSTDYEHPVESECVADPSDEGNRPTNKVSKSEIIPSNHKPNPPVKRKRKRPYIGRSEEEKARGTRGHATYKISSEKMPELLLKAKELTSSWKQPKCRSKEETEIENFRLACQNQTISYLNNELFVTKRVKQTNPMYILMELRKSMISHDWAGVKNLLKIFYSSSNDNDKVGWKACVTAMMYYPNGESVLQAFIEENKMGYTSRDILFGLININGLQPFSSQRYEQDLLLPSEEDSEPNEETF